MLSWSTQLDSRRILWRRPRYAKTKQTLCALAPHHRVRDLVSVSLVGVPDLTNASPELHAAALLHNMRGFVRNCVQVRATAEYDMVPRRVRLGAHRSCAGRSIRRGVGLDPRNVVPAEQALDRLGVRQW